MDQAEKLTLVAGKIGTLRMSVEGCNVSVPDSVQVTGAREKNKYVNGAQTDEVEKIALSVIDVKAVEVAKQAGFDLSSMPTIAAEIQEPELVSHLTGHADQLVGKQLPTAGALIALRWVSYGNSGSWNALKLIFDAKQLISRKGEK